MVDGSIYKIVTLFVSRNLSAHFCLWGGSHRLTTQLATPLSLAEWFNNRFLLANIAIIPGFKDGSRASLLMRRYTASLGAQQTSLLFNPLTTRASMSPAKENHALVLLPGRQGTVADWA